MELKLTDGNYSAANQGGISTVSGIDEIVQRILMKLCAKRGEFLPLPDFGSRLHTLHSYKPSIRKLVASQFVVEALADESDLSLVSLELEYLANDSVQITVFLDLSNQPVTLSAVV